MILILITILTIFLIVLFNFNTIDYFQNDTSPPTIENDIAITQLVNPGIGPRCQHAAVYKTQTAFVIYVIRFTKKESILVLNDKFQVIDKIDHQPGYCIQIVDDYLFTSAPYSIYRWQLDPQTGLIADKVNPKLTVRGMPTITPIFIIDNKTKDLYIHIPSKTNACQSLARDRKKGFPGEMPCVRLINTSGVWKFKATQLNQSLDMGILYATGVRSLKSMVMYNKYLYGIILGRDSLFELYPDIYTKEQGDQLASDELVQLDQNTNFGFPYCYWDGNTSYRKLAPEYGGDGTFKGHCNSLIAKPLAIFDDHRGPNDLMIYNNKLFIAWNGKPSPLKCDVSCSALSVTFFNISEDEMALGKYETLVEFNVSHKTKPSGLVHTPDGSIIIVDSLHGKIWKSNFKAKADS